MSEKVGKSVIVQSLARQTRCFHSIRINLACQGFHGSLLFASYTKNRNYWKYLKTKLKAENNELVSGTNQFKLIAPDGKRRLTDVLDYEGIMALAKIFPNNRASEFLDWFTFSNNTIDGQSRKKLILSLKAKPP